MDTIEVLSGVTEGVSQTVQGVDLYLRCKFKLSNMSHWHICQSQSGLQSPRKLTVLVHLIHSS